MKTALGIDIGTTSIKVILIAPDGQVLGDWSMPHGLSSPQQGYAEEDTQVWKEHLLQILTRVAREADVSRLSAIGVTGMTPALVVMDGQGNVLRPSIQQNDARALEEMERFRRRFGDEWLLARTGSRMNCQHIAPKLAWIKRYENDVFRKIRHVTGSYGYAAWLLTGRFRTERNWALESGMYDIHAGTWLGEVLKEGDVAEDWLAPLAKPTDLVGTLREEIAGSTGLPQGVPIYAGTADHIASTLCVGARLPGDLVFKLGGAGDILLAIDHLETDPRLYIDYGVTSEAPYVMNGCTATCGSLLEWMGRELGMSDFVEMDRLASQIAPGADGVTVLPYFLGEKTPLFDPYAKGTIFGLSLSHTKAHVWRALLEAVAFCVRSHVEIFRERGLPIQRAFITNGGSKSTLWRQILADATSLDLTYVRHNPGSCLGAAMIAAIGAGLMPPEGIDRFLTTESVNLHDPSKKETYDHAYQRFLDLYGTLKPLMRA